VMMGLFWFKRKKNDGRPNITVELNIIAFIANEYINDTIRISVPHGSTLKQLLKTAKQQGKIKKGVYHTIRGLRPPVSLIVNGDNMENIKKTASPVADGDKITVFTPLSGG